MRFTLKDFQEEAVAELLKGFKAARTLYDVQQMPSSITLTATTGAGKTVMASAVIESLFFGNDQYDFPADSHAVVLWVTDDPSLNEQTRWRFIESSELIDFPRLEVIGDGFDQDTFDPLKVYFLNRQKLAKTSNLVKRRNTRNTTLWETIQNTIADPTLNLYMILDEAHKGLGDSSANGSGDDESDRQTLYAQLIDGHEGDKPMPVVLGISATIERFSAAMQSRKRTQIGAVEVNPSDVQASGLLKDTISLLIPDEAGSFDAALMKEACKALVESERQWQAYCEQQDVKPVKPLMVVQVPNSVTEDELFILCEQIQSNIPSLDGICSYGNVFGEHADIVLGIGKYLLKYIHPQDVEDDSIVRILFAKEAVSTGWDCPRAEVLFSMRPGQDKTYIMQLVGRMVRTPLARRIEGNDVLNSVACFLPRFNRATTQEVANYLTGDLVSDDDAISQMSGRKVLTTPITLIWDSSLGKDVADAFEALPTKLKPGVAGNQVERLFNLAHKIAGTGIDENAIDSATEFVTNVIKGDCIKYKKAYEEALEEVHVAHTHRADASRLSGEVLHYNQAIEADKAIIQAGFEDASRALTPFVAKQYLKNLLVSDGRPDPLDAQAMVAAIALVPDIMNDIVASCVDYADSLFNEYRDAIYGLSDEDIQAFEEVRAKSEAPQPGRIVRPVTDMVNSCLQIGDTEMPLPTMSKHVLSRIDDHMTPVRLNDFEARVVNVELAKPDTVAWYRNPSGASKSAVQIPWKNNGRWRSMQPDFIFFSRMQDGSIKPSIIDPHGDYFADALPKLEGFAAYADEYADAFKRLEAVATIGGKDLFLNLKDAEIRKSIQDGMFENAEAVYVKLGKTYN